MLEPEAKQKVLKKSKALDIGDSSSTRVKKESSTKWPLISCLSMWGRDMPLTNPRLALWARRYPKASTARINNEGVNGKPYLTNLPRECFMTRIY